MLLDPYVTGLGIVDQVVINSEDHEVYNPEIHILNMHVYSKQVLLQ